MSEQDDDLTVAEAALHQLEAAAVAARADLQKVMAQRGLRTERQLTDQEREVLRVHGSHFISMANYVRDLDQEDMETLLEVCKAATETNCGWDSYRAAQFLKEEIGIRMMAERAAAATTTQS